MLRINFNEGWKFSKDNSTMMSSDRTEPIEVNLPHDAMIHENRDASYPSGNAGAFFEGSNYLYMKEFELPTGCEAQAVYLEFEGIYHKARIYVNESFAGMCLNGFRRFVLDITPYVNETEKNIVKVLVQNSDQPNCRWYTGGGIYRSVNLMIGSKVHMEPDGIAVCTPEVEEEISLVTVAMNYRNLMSATKKVRFLTTIENRNGDVAAQENTLVTLFPLENPKVYQRIFVMPAMLWSLENPHLYICRVKILDEQDKVLDESIVEFGIRKIQADPLHGLRLNGKEIKLRGTNIHHDNGILGAASFCDAEERKVRMLKEAGFNAIRMAHNPASVQLLKACDKVGMLVMDECFDMWTRGKNPYDDAWSIGLEWEKELEAIVKKDRNHPSVFLYCIGNEIQEIGTLQGVSMNRNLINKFHELDPTRLVTNAVNGLMTVIDSEEELIDIMKEFGILSEGFRKEPEDDINDVMTILREHTNEVMQHSIIGERLEESLGALDIAGYNYMRGRYEMDVKENPNHILFGSETYPFEIDKNWSLVETYPQILGDFTWTGWDYLGEAGIGIAEYNKPVEFFKPFPSLLGYCGDYDIVGNRRPVSYFREIVWGFRKDPYVSVDNPKYYNDQISCTPWTMDDSVESWTWSGYEGMPIRIHVFSPAEEVALFLNGAYIGKVKTGKNHCFQAVFDTVYYPGVLEAVALELGNVVGRFQLNTADSNVQLLMTADKRQVRANGEDLAFFSIVLQDESGVVNPQINKKIRIKVIGDGILQGFGSANPCSAESYDGKVCTTYQGRALAVIRAGRTKGWINICLEAEGCEPVYTEIEVID